jgi:hypothetical protein
MIFGLGLDYFSMADKSIIHVEPSPAASAAATAAAELQADLAQAKQRIEAYVNQNEQDLTAAVSEHEAVMVALEGLCMLLMDATC